MDNLINVLDAVLALVQNKTYKYLTRLQPEVPSCCLTHRKYSLKVTCCIQFHMHIYREQDFTLVKSKYGLDSVFPKPLLMKLKVPFVNMTKMKNMAK